VPHRGALQGAYSYRLPNMKTRTEPEALYEAVSYRSGIRGKSPGGSGGVSQADVIESLVSVVPTSSISEEHERALAASRQGYAHLRTPGAGLGSTDTRSGC